MIRQSTDSSLGQRVRAAMAVTVAVFALSLSYWGVLVKQESQASTTGQSLAINFDSLPAGEISNTVYPDLTITPRAAVYPKNTSNCGSNPNALYILDRPGGSAPLDITFTNNQVSDWVVLDVIHVTTAGPITVQALDINGAVIDTQNVSTDTNSCLSTGVSFTAGSSTGIAHIRLFGTQASDGNWGVDDFKYAPRQLPATSQPNNPVLTGVEGCNGNQSEDTLTWNNVGSGITYNVYRNSATIFKNVSGSPYKESVTAGTTSLYTVVAVNSVGDKSGASNVVTITGKDCTAQPANTLSFSVTPMTGTAPLTVTGSSPSANVSRTWNWGDSSAPEQQHALCGGVGPGICGQQDLIHTYSSPGSYIVTVTQADFAGTNTETSQKTITVTESKQQVSLSTSKSIYNIAETVSLTFKNIGPAAITLVNSKPLRITGADGQTWFDSIPDQIVTTLDASKDLVLSWDQKNNSAILPNTQVAEGVYTATVTYTSNSEKKIATTNFTIAKQGTPTAPTFTYKIDPTSGTAPLTVKTTVTGTGADATAPLWDFGDGSTATGVSVSHTYATAGTYTATVRIGSQVGTQQVVVSNAIVNASPAPKKLAQTGMSLSLVLLTALIISGVLSYLIIRRPFHSNN